MKTKINLIINIISFICFLVISFTGIVLWRVLPSGSGFQGGRGFTEDNIFLGLFRHQWNDIHNYIGLLLIILVLLHLALHWPWVKNIPKLFRS